MTTPSETSFRNTSKTYYKLDHSAIIGMHFSHRSWPDHFKAFPNVRLAQTRMWQPNIMVWGLTWATEAVGFVNGLAWPGLAGRLLQTLISITLQNLSWTSSFCRHRIALSSPILIGSFQHYTSNSLSSKTLTDVMNLIRRPKSRRVRLLLPGGFTLLKWFVLRPPRTRCVSSCKTKHSRAEVLISGTLRDYYICSVWGPDGHKSTSFIVLFERTLFCSFLVRKVHLVQI